MKIAIQGLPSWRALAGMLTVFWAAQVIASEPLPAAILALQKQGASITGTFTSVNGLRVYTAVMGGQPLSLYVMPDGHRVILGMALDDAGASADEAVFQRTVAQAPTQTSGEAAWKQLESSHWIADGKSSAARVVYVFTDPNCPYCARLWADARPWVDSGKVQIRHVIIGILRPSSPAMAEALLADRDPASLFLRFEGSHAQAVGKVVAGVPSNAKPEEILKPTKETAAKAQAWVEANDQLMASMGLFATPGVVWRDANGSIQKHAGVAPEMMSEVFGPR